jgi:hypothetical protein
LEQERRARDQGGVMAAVSSAWLLALMVSVYPPRSTPRETEPEMRARFASIAYDDALVVERDGPVPTLTVPETEALILAVSWHEAGWRVDVDRGETKGGGRDGCLMQLRDAPPDALTDRTVCFREGLKKLKASWKLCAESPEPWRLAAYASGGCVFGRKESAAILAPWRGWLAAHPPPRGGS